LDRLPQLISRGYLASDAAEGVMADDDGVVGDYRRRRRRSWSLEQKLAILEDLASSSDPLAEVARRHGMNANHLLSWRGRARAGMLERRRGRPPGSGLQVGFVQVGVVGAAIASGQVMASDQRIEVELPGGAKVRFEAGVDGGRLCGVLRAVRSAL
jgi:transposase-like protein